MTNSGYTIKPGAYVVVWLTGQTRKFIAEVVRVEPLHIKVMEEGPLAHLKEGDFIIIDDLTAQIQNGHKHQQKLLTRFKLYGHPLLSGLRSLGVTDEKIYEIYPTNDHKPAKTL